MLRDAWSNDGGKGWWRWWSRLGGLLAMATAISCLVAPFPGASANSEAKRLYDDLLSNYNRLIRPVGNNSDRLTVKMGLRLSQLIDVVSRQPSSPPIITTHCTYLLATLISYLSLSLDITIIIIIPSFPPIETHNFDATGTENLGSRDSSGMMDTYPRMESLVRAARGWIEVEFRLPEPELIYKRWRAAHIALEPLIAII